MATSQNNFPVAVHINASSWPTQSERDLFFDSNTGGKRILFFDSDETTSLPYEVEYFSNVQGSEEAIYWVKVPEVAAASTTDKIVVAYGNDPYSADQDNPKMVWDGNFKGVWHLGNGTTLSASDSTVNGNNGTISGATATAGRVDGGGKFNGSSYIDFGNPSSLNISGNLTVTCFVNIDNVALTKEIYDKGDSNYLLRSISSQIIASMKGADNNWYEPSFSATSGTWYHIAQVKTSTQHQLYANGSLQSYASMSVNPQTFSNNFYVGYFPGGGRYYNGYLDELRISNIDRSADWLKLEYYSMKKTNYNGDNDGTNKFITFGSQTNQWNTAPDAPSSLAQYKSDCTTSITTGGWTNETSVCLKGYINDADTNDQVKIAAEVQTGSFTGTPNFTASSYVTDPNTSSVTASSLVNSSQYRWQGRSLDDDAATSGFTQFNSGNLSFGVDTSAPSGGSIGYTDGYYTTASVALTAADGTDGASGINTSSRTVQRKSATLTNGTCGSYGSFATITPTGTYPNFIDATVVSGNCYQYQYLVSDNATNQATYISTNTAKIDTAAPTGGSITYTNGYYTSTSVSLTAADGTDTVSGVNTSSRIMQRRSATLTAGTCGSYGSYSTISPTGTYPNYTDSTVVSGNCYQYQYLVSDNATNQATYTSTNTAKIDTSTPDIVAVDAGASSGDRTSLTSNTWFKYSDTGSDDQISFSWTDPASASDDTFYYELNASSGNTVDGTESSTTNPYIDSITVSEGTNYFHVRPRNGASTWGTERTFTVKYDKSGPTGASISNITADSTTQLTANGNTAADSGSGLHATPYWFDETTGNSGGSDSTDWQAGTSWVDTGLSANTQYTYRVKAKDTLNNESSYSATSSKYTLASQVTSPAATNATTKSNYKINLNWTNQGQSGIKIEQDTGCDGYETTSYDNASSTPATPYSINVAANTCYQFRISSYNGDGAINSTSIPETSPITTPPAQPTGLTHTDNTKNSIDWNWSDVSGATGYKVYRNSDDQLLATINTATSNWTQNSLNSDTQYSVYVRATNANGEGIASLSASAYTSADTPINTNHSTNTMNSLTWTWDSGGSEKDFYAWCADPADNSGWIDLTSWLQGSLSANDLYQFFVKARNEENDETGSASASHYTSQNTPTGISFDDVATDSITLSAEGTFPNLSGDSSGLYFNNVTASQNSGWKQTNSWVNSSLSPNTEYSYKVKAQNGDSDETAYTSEELQYTLANTPGAPTVNTSTINTLKVIINQNSNPAGTEYAIYETSTSQYVDQTDGSLDQVSEDWDTFANWGGAGGMTVTGLAENTTYTFKVKARNNDGVETALSSGASGTTVNSPGAPTLVSPADGTYTTDTTPTLSAHYSDADVGDTGTTSCRISSTSAADCLNNLNIVSSGSSVETTTNDEDTTFTPASSLGSDAAYYWCAQNSDGTNTSSWTSMGSFTLDTSTPDIVAVDAGPSSGDRTSLTSDDWFDYAGTGSDDQISFSWTDPSSLSNDTFYYELNADSGDTIAGIESNVTSPYIDDISVSEGTNYFHVKPKNGALTWGTERIFIMKYDKSAPAGGSITYTDGYYDTTSVSLTANDGTDAGSGIDGTSRIFERKETTLAGGSCGVYGAYAVITPAGTYPDYSDTTVANGNCYQYRYSVSDNLGNQTIYTSTNTAKIDTEAPTGTTLSLGTITETSVTATVSGAADAISGLNATPYYFEMDSTGSPQANSGWQAGTSWESALLSPNTAYTFRVKSRDAALNASAYTADQEEYTLANIPSNLTLTADLTTQITAEWEANSNPIGTEYYAENETAGTNSDWITDTSWASTGLAENTSYTFRVKARNVDLTDTGWSAEVSEETLSSLIIDDDDDDDDNDDDHKASNKVNETVSNLPYYISNLPNIITEEINEAIKEEKQEEYIIPLEAPPAMKGEWNLLPVDIIGEFVLAPLPSEITSLAEKFPALQETFNKLGITGLSDIGSLQNTELTLPGLSRIIGLRSGDIGKTEFSRIPSEIVFAKTAGEKIDLNIKVNLTGDGKVEQKINTTSGKTITLIVKPESAVNNIKGYLVFRSNEFSQTNSQVLGWESVRYNLEEFLKSSVFSKPKLARAHNPDSIETRLVLSEFDYADPDNDGIYTADIQTPQAEGTYEVITVMDYKDVNLGKKEIRLIAVVDPEGYVYERIKNNELRIMNAVVSLYHLADSGQYELWPAGSFQQTNPQTTDVTGKYSFLVPPGKYYLTAEAKGHKAYKSEIIEVQEGGGIHKNIELKSSDWLKNFYDRKAAALVVVILLLGYNFYRDRKNRVTRNM